MNWILVTFTLIVVSGISFTAISGGKVRSLRKHNRRVKQTADVDTTLKLNEKQGEHSARIGQIEVIEGCSGCSKVKGRKDRRRNKLKHRKAKRKRRIGRRKQKKNRSSHRKSRLSLPRGHGLLLKDKGHDNPWPDREYRKPHFLSEVEYPSGVERLEYRLRPTPVVPLKKFYHLANDVIRKIKQHMARTHVSYNYTFNTMRYDFVMNLRKAIKKINDANDVAYGVVLDASRLTKEIFLRAHNSHLTGPSTASLRRPEAYFADLTMPMYQSDSEFRTSQDVYSKIKDMRWRAERLDNAVMLMSDFVGLASLRDLRNRSQQVIFKLDQDLMIGQLKAKFRDQKYVKSAIKESETYLMDSRVDIVRAFDTVREAENKYEDNVKFKANALMQKGKRDPLRVTRKSTPSLSESEYMTLKQVISQAKNHADSLYGTKKYMEIHLIPALSVAKKVKHRGSRPHDDKFYVYKMTQKLEDDIKRLAISMDSLRLFIGDLEGIKQRCEEIDGSGYGPMPESILDCDQFVEEGSGYNFTQLPPESTTVSEADDDFVFVETEDSKPESSLIKEKTLGDKMRTFSGNVKNNSEVVLNQVDVVYHTVSDASVKWKSTNNALKFTEKSNRDIKTTLFNITNDQSTVEKIKDAMDIPEKLSSIDSNLKLTISECQKANATIEQKLAELKSKNVGSEDKPQKENAVDFSEAREEVNKLNSQVKKIRALKTILPDSCRKIQDTRNSIQDNILQLRSKIEKFRSITANLQMPRSLSGDEYLSLPVSGHRLPSMTSSFEMCVKPANVESDTIVALIQGNNSISYTIGIDDGEAEVNIYDGDGSELDSITLDDMELQDNEWYKFLVTREGKRYSFSCHHLASGSNQTKDIVISASPIKQSDPLQIYIAGFDSNRECGYFGCTTNGAIQLSSPDYFWKGCASDVKWNRELINVFVDGSKGNQPQVCSSDCPTKRVPSFVFNGKGFIHYSLSKVTGGDKALSLSLKFRTWQERSLIAAVVIKRQRLQVSLHIVNGVVIIEYRGRSQYRLTTTSANFSDGEFHTITLSDLYRDDYGKNILIDGGSEFTAIRARIDIHPADDGIYIGGIIHNNLLQGNDKFGPFSGCMRKVLINGKGLALEKADTVHRVHFGTCNASDIDNCVRFTTNSSNITLPEYKKTPPNVHMILSSDAKGHLLQFSRHEKYHFEIMVGGDGLEIHQSDDRTEPDSAKIQATEGMLPWKSVSVIDNENSKVIISLDGQSVEFEYAGDGWFGGTKKYKVSFGGKGDNSDQFTGGILKVLVQNRSIRLRDYVSSDSLSSCTETITMSSEDAASHLFKTETAITTTEAPVPELLQCS